MEIEQRYDGTPVNLRETIRQLFFGEKLELLEKTFDIADDDQLPTL